MKSLYEYVDVERLLAAPKAIYEKAYMKMENVRDAYFAHLIDKVFSFN